MTLLKALAYEYYGRETDGTNRAAMLATFGLNREVRFADDALAIFASGIATPAGQNAARYLFRIDYPGFRGEVLADTIEALTLGKSAREKQLVILGLEEFQTRYPEARAAIETALITDAAPGVAELALEVLARGARESARFELLARTAIGGRTQDLRRKALDLFVTTGGNMADGRRDVLLRVSQEAPDAAIRDRAEHLLMLMSKAESSKEPLDVILPK